MSKQVEVEKKKQDCEADKKMKIKIDKEDIFGLLVMAALIVGAVALRCAVFLPRYM